MKRNNLRELDRGETAVKWGAHAGGKSTNRPRVIYEFGQFRLDREAHLLVSGEKIVALEPKAVEVLLILVEKRGELVARQDLMSAVWPDTFVEESNLSSNISILRKQLGVTPDGGDYIQTIPKRGYRFVAAVKQVQNEPPILRFAQEVRSGAAPAVESESNRPSQPAGLDEAGTAGRRRPGV